MKNCCVLGCGNRLVVGQKSPVTFHLFPTDASLRLAWLDALGTRLKSHSLAKYTYVCSEHFADGVVKYDHVHLPAYGKMAGARVTRVHPRVRALLRGTFAEYAA